MDEMIVKGPLNRYRHQPIHILPCMLHIMIKTLYRIAQYVVMEFQIPVVLTRSIQGEDNSLLVT